MRLLAFALSVALAGPTLAQNSSMDVGSQALDLRYQPGDAAATLAAFDGTVTSVGFYGSTAAFSGFYGSQTTLTSPTGVSVGGFDVSLGGNVHMVPLGARGSLYLPLRFQVGSRYLSGDGAPGDPTDDMAVLLGGADLGTGLGAVVDVPLSEGSAVERLHTYGTVVLGAGFSGDYAMSFPGDTPDPGAYGMRTATVMLQSEARGLFGSSVGASLGYTFRAAQLDTEAIDSGAGVFNAFTGSNFRSAETSHLIRVGLIF